MGVICTWELFGLLASPMRADTVAFSAAADTSLFSPNPNNNLGATDTLVVGTTAHGQASRGLIRFDVGQGIPISATVVSARLEFSVVKAPADAVASRFRVHRMLVDWAEGSGNDGIGEPATPGAPTWVERVHPGELWSQPGGAPGQDFVAEPSGAVLVSDPGRYSISGEGLLRDVQQWLAGSVPNAGWLLRSDDEATPTTARRVGSREDPEDPPKLVIDYTFGLPPVLLRFGLRASVFEMEFRAEAGKSYEVHYLDRLGATALWQVLDHSVTGPVSTNVLASDSLSASMVRFYRVVEVEPTQGSAWPVRK